MSDPTVLSEYLVLSCGQWDESASQAEIQAAIDSFYVWYEQLVAQGTIKRGQRLARERKTVSRLGVVDGPFAETKEMIGGYWIIVAASLQQAAEIASRNPCLAFGLSYEIGPIEPARASAYVPACETPVSRA
jgi:hypothetical protein